MEITHLPGSTTFQVYLHLALHDAISEYEAVHAKLDGLPPLTEETATPELTLLHYALAQRTITVLVLAACCVEAVGNLYLGHKATPDQFESLESASLLDKWCVLPSLFLPQYVLPKDGVLYQDLKRLISWRNALVHLKETVTGRGGAVKHKGSLPKQAAEHVFVCRCASLSDNLLKHVASYDKTDVPGTVQIALAVPQVILEMRRLVNLSPEQLMDEMQKRRS